jgi:hypothetical protein
MPVPAKGDPRRPLHLAVRSTRLLGIVFIVFGLLMLLVVPAAFRSRGAAAAGPPAAGPPVWLGVVVAMMFMAPGVMYLVVGAFLARRKSWAVVVGIVVASVHGLFALLVFLRNLVVEPGNMVSLLIVLAWVAALAQLIYHLSQSFAAIRYESDHVQRGFEPLFHGSMTGTQPFPPPLPPPPQGPRDDRYNVR